MAVEVEDILKVKRQEILRIAEKHGAFDLRVFGSRARGSAGPASDFDFLIKVGPRHTPWFPGGLVADLEDLLGGKVDVVTEAGLHPLLRDRVLKEAVAL
jgi:predicted nucleotidyltransferase